MTAAAAQGSSSTQPQHLRVMTVGGIHSFINGTITLKLAEMGMAVTKPVYDRARVPDTVPSGVDLVCVFVDMMPRGAFRKLQLDAVKKSIPVVCTTRKQAQFAKALERYARKVAPAPVAPKVRRPAVLPPTTPEQVMIQTATAAAPEIDWGARQLVAPLKAPERPTTTAKSATSLELITPEQARLWLATQPVNRRLREDRAIELAQMIEDGRWQPDVSTIKLNSAGKLVDGQHRCKAIDLANKPVYCLVTRDFDESAIQYVDTGKSRNLGDFLGMAGHQNTSKLAAVLTHLAKLERRSASNPALTLDEAQDVLTRHRLGVEMVMGATRSANKLNGVNRAPVLAPIAYARPTDTTKVDDFMNRLVDGLGLTAGSPVLLLRNLMLGQGPGKGSGSSPTLSWDMGLKVLRMLQAHIRGEQPTKVTGSEGALEFFAKAHGPRR